MRSVTICTLHVAVTVTGEESASINRQKRKICNRTIDGFAGKTWSVKDPPSPKYCTNRYCYLQSSKNVKMFDFLYR